jgi:hypothetical protein
MQRYVFALPIVIGLLLWALPLAVAPAPIVIDVGSEAGLNNYGEGHNLYNFFGWSEPQPIPGGSVRRSVDGGNLIVPWAFRLGQPLDVTVRWCECVDHTTPLTLSINGASQALPIAADFRTDTYRVPFRRSIYERDLRLSWPASNGVGPVIDTITLRPAIIDGRLDGSVAATLGLAIIVALGWRRLGARELAAWVGLIGITLLAGRAAYRIQALPWTALVILGLSYAALLTRFVGDWRGRVALWVAGVWLLAAAQVLGSWVLDDAFISFRYSRNLIEGYGLTFNPGGEIVEGYTNFLWTITIALGLALGYEPLVAAQLLTLAFALATLVLLYRFAKDWLGERWAALPPALLALNAPFVLYSARGSGMETAQITFLALLALWLLWRAHDGRSGLIAGLACAAVTLARPDGALVPLAGGIVLVARLLFERRASTWRILLGLCGGFAVCYGPYFAWRLAYYGYLLPNTFYAKTGFTSAQLRRGWSYTADFATLLGLRSLLALLALSAAALLIPAIRRRAAAGPAPLLWTLLLLTVAYVVAVGGDHFPHGRFFIPILPPLMLLFVYGLRSVVAARLLLPKLAGWAAVGLGGAILALSVVRNVQQFPPSDSRIPARPIWGENSVALKNREVGYWLFANTPPETVITTGIAGTLPYYSQRTVIDALGLNDLHIAHLSVPDMGSGDAGSEKTDPAYILDQKPDIIPFSTSGDFQPLPRFQAEYELIEVVGPEGRGIKLFVRKDRSR